MAWQTGVVSDRGRVRTNNEDSVYINPEQGIFLIADGMGGHNAGEVASGLAVDAISTFLLNATPDALEKAVENANRIIYERSRHSPELYRMGTTIVAAVIAGTKLFLAHVGDSRAYLLEADRLQRLTEDHSLIYQMIKSQQISEAEASIDPRRGILLRALGTEEHIEVELHEYEYRGEPLLLCSDGLTDMLTDPEIEAVLRAGGTPQETCEQLKQRANEMGGADNISAILVKGA